jgi:hypothetical protein
VTLEVLVNDLFDVVGELASTSSPKPEVIDRQRAELMAAIWAEKPHGDEPRGESSRRARSVLGRVRPRRALLLGGIAATIAAILVVTLAVVPRLGRPQSAAAAVLDQAAAAAGQFTTPGPRQFLYVETQSTYGLTIYGPSGTPGLFDKVATTTFGITDQSWTNASGTGQARSMSGVPGFSPAAEQVVNRVMGPGFLSRLETGPPDTGSLHQASTPPEVADLPTDPAKLTSVLASGALGTGQSIASSPVAVFERAARLLVGPTSGMTSALASALFQVMADQPGAKLLGRVTDHNGQPGEGVELKSVVSTTGVRALSEVIVDPKRGRVLEVDYASPPATTTTDGGSKGLGTLSPLWTDVVASGVVGSNTGTVPASGTAKITATQVPGAPTGLAATVRNGVVNLSWDAPPSGAGPVTNYHVYELGPKGGGEADTRSAATAYAWRLPTLGKTMRFAVQAVNELGYGPRSAYITITP